jgi:nitrilase
VARYDKIHLFHYDNGRERYTEGAVVQPGHTPVTCDITARDGQHWRLGLSVCYDLRFPELYRRLADQGADLLLVPAAFTHTTGLAHWEVLLRARAIENQAYLLAPAQGGRHENGRRTWGHSLLADPWGMLLAQQAEGPGVVLGDISRERLAHVRRQLPSLEHRVL